MNSQRIIWLCVLMLTLAVDSCDEIVNMESPAPEPTPDQDLITDFPSKVGSTWVYAIHDTSYLPPFQIQSIITDTLSVVILNKTVLSDSHHTSQWANNFSDRTDTVGVDIFSDSVLMAGTLRVYSSLYTETRDAKYFFPLEVGRRWGAIEVLSWDTSIVLGQRSLTVPAGTFDSTFHISRSTASVGPYSGMGVQVWFAPGVGFLRIHQSEGFLGPVFKKVALDLVRYTLAGNEWSQQPANTNGNDAQSFGKAFPTSLNRLSGMNRE